MSAQPRWLHDLPPHIRLTSSQIERLELIRSHTGVGDDEFHLHVRTHPESTKALQRSLFDQMRAEDPSAPTEQLLVQLVYSRLVTARMQGDDLFGLARFPLADPERPSHELVAAIIALVRAKRWSRVDHLADAIVAEEAVLPDNVPGSPAAKDAQEQVTRILRESANR